MNNPENTWKYSNLRTAWMHIFAILSYHINLKNGHMSIHSEFCSVHSSVLPQGTHNLTCKKSYKCKIHHYIYVMEKSAQHFLFLIFH